MREWTLILKVPPALGSHIYGVIVGEASDIMR
jgi:hypothetical protein